MTLLRSLYELFPPRARERIKLALGAHGHGQSRLDGWKARDHANGKKRLDRVAEAVVQVLARAGVTSLRGLSCLEFGAGYVPAETLVFHLLGAGRTVATDYNAIARMDQLATSAQAADRDRVLQLLSPFAVGVDIEQRLDALRGPDAKRYIAEHIIYIAPHDMSVAPLLPAFDIIHSVSVFEHLPAPLAQAILARLVESLTPGGRLLTEIDLRDHRDLENHPLAFFAADTDYDPGSDADLRGNRLRRSEWLEMFARQPGLHTRQTYQEVLDQRFLPDSLIPGLGGVAPEDIIVAWLWLSSQHIESPAEP